MATPQFRPTFRVPLEYPRDAAVDKIRAGLVARDELQGRWRGRGSWAEIHVPEAERRVWSPYLSLRVEDAGDAAELSGRFAPHPGVWTFFMFVYFGIAFLVLLGGSLGYAQWASDEPAWGLWAVWLGIPALGLLHLASAVGQRLGRDQMRDLHTLIFEVLDEIGGRVGDSRGSSEEVWGA